MKSEKKLKGWQIALLIIFYPIGIIYLIVKLCTRKKVTDIAPNNSAIAEARAQQVEALEKKFAEDLNSIEKVDVNISGTPVARRKKDDVPEFKITNITRSTNINNIFPLVVVDVETTGFNPYINEIIEVSAIKYDVDFVPISCFSTLVKPRHSITEEITQINHITNEMVENAPSFGEVASSLSEYISGCCVVGHNVLFDLRFLFANGVDIPNKRIFDTLDIAKKLLTTPSTKKYDHHEGRYVENDNWDVLNHKLSTLCEYYNIFRNDAHRSLSDCYATGLLLVKLLEEKVDYSFVGEIDI